MMPSFNVFCPRSNGTHAEERLCKTKTENGSTTSSGMFSKRSSFGQSNPGRTTGSFLSAISRKFNSIKLAPGCGAGCQSLGGFRADRGNCCSSCGRRMATDNCCDTICGRCNSTAIKFARPAENDRRAQTAGRRRRRSAGTATADF